MFMTNELNQKIEDIFSDVEKSLPENKAANLLDPTFNSELAATDLTPKKDYTKAIASIGIVVLIVAVLSLLGLFFVKSGILTKAPSQQNKIATEGVQIPSDNSAVAVTNINTAPDSDHDGLSDAYEKNYNTNPEKADTDADGLFDGEEVHTYKTDPLKADTDGDGHLDGEEVKGGYNPLGAGQLLNFEEAKKELNKQPNN